MDASEIKALRVLLASEAAAQTEPRRAPGGVLGRLFVRPPQSAPGPAQAPDPAPFDLDPLELAPPEPAPVAAERIDTLPIGVPPMGLWAPRRAAFGQRRAVRQEIVLDLVEPAPAQPARLMLTSPDGARVGEIILHTGEAAPPAARRPFEPLHAETPFFPEDLEDRPAHRLPPALAMAPPPAQKPPKARAQKAGPEMASTFLLAGLAARLAREEAALSARIAALA